MSEGDIGPQLLLLNQFVKFGPKLIGADKANPFLDHISRAIKQVKFWLVIKTELALQLAGSRVICIQIIEIDLAELIHFKPMHDGRH